MRGESRNILVYFLTGPACSQLCHSLKCFKVHLFWKVSPNLYFRSVSLHCWNLSGVRARCPWALQAEQRWQLFLALFLSLSSFSLWGLYFSPKRGPKILSTLLTHKKKLIGFHTMLYFVRQNLKSCSRVLILCLRLSVTKMLWFHRNKKTQTTLLPPALWYIWEGRLNISSWIRGLNFHELGGNV